MTVTRWLRPGVPGAVAIVVVIATAGLLWSTARLVGYGWSTFVVSGERFVDESSTPAELLVYPGAVGYDGQQYYRLSRAPWDTAAVVDGIPLDDGAYRMQRILYPVAAATVARLTGTSTLVTLAVVNVAMAGLLAWLVGRWALQHGRTAWWGAVVAFLPPIYFGVTRDLAEPMAMALMVAGIVSWQRRPWLGSVALSAAVLTRETTLVAAAGYGFAALHRAVRTRQWRPLVTELPPTVLPLLVFVGWQAWLSTAWGETGLTGGTLDRAGLPFRGLAGLAVGAAGLQPAWLGRLVHLGPRVLLLVALAVGTWLVTRDAGNDDTLALRISFALALAVLLLRANGWATPASAMRSASEVVVIGSLFALTTGERGRFWFWPMACSLPLIRFTG